jgi:AcrR family transcriptional regulator
MGRTRVISEEQVLDAAENVVKKKGASHLTIEAVASQAGISKASVLYIYKTKGALIKAVVDRLIRADAAVNESAITGLGQVDDAVIRGRILAASDSMKDEMRSVALNLTASLAHDPRLRKSGRLYLESVVTRIKETSAHPRGAMLAHLALEGMKLLELLDLHTWTESERKHLMKDIEWLVGTDPGRPLSQAAPGVRKAIGAPKRASRPTQR